MSACLAKGGVWQRAFCACLVTVWLAACDAGAPVVTVEEDPNRIEVAGLWAGVDDAGVEQHLVCLKLVEPDSAAAFEMVAVDTLEGSGLIATAEGKWSYRPPRIEVELFAWPDPRGVPRITAELGSAGTALLLRIAYRQGDQIVVGLNRTTRCGRFRDLPPG